MFIRARSLFALLLLILGITSPTRADPIGGTCSAVFSLGAPTQTGDVFSFDLNVTFSGPAPFQMVYLELDVTNSSAALAPGGDFSAFGFMPSFPVGWQPVLGFPIPGGFAFDVDLSVLGNQGLMPSVNYLVGKLTYDVSVHSIVPSPALMVSLIAPFTLAGAEDPTNPGTFAFLTPTFAPGERPLDAGQPGGGGGGGGGSGTQVPEPSTLALFALGGILAASTWKRRRAMHR